MEVKEIVMSDEETRKLFANLKVVFNSQEADEHKLAITKTLINRWIIYKAEISFKAEMKEVVEWGDEVCTHFNHSFPYIRGRLRRTCNECWQAFKKEKGL